MVKARTTKKRTSVIGQAASRKATALHATHKDGKTHAVGILNLRVLIEQDGKFWVAQGLEVDYASYGTTIEQAQRRFESGLRSTIHHNLEAFGSIMPILKLAPDEIWKKFWELGGVSERKQYSQFSIHEIQADSVEPNKPEPDYREVKIEYDVAA
jgi:hypothetical protein